MNQGYKGHFWYTYTKGGSGDTCYAMWKPNIPADGQYEVKVYIPFSNAINAVYRVFYFNGSAEVVVNQKAYTNQWVTLGVFPFKQGNSGSVRLGDNSVSAGQELVFDAIRWNFAGPLLSSDELQNNEPNFAISGIYPNPFNPETTVEFSLAIQGNMELVLYSSTGEKIKTVESGYRQSGKYSVKLSGEGLTSGLYFLVLQSGDRRTVKKISLIK